MLSTGSDRLLDISNRLRLRTGLKPVTFVVFVCSCLGFLIGSISREWALTYLALTPGRALLTHYYLWQGLTSHFVELGIIKFLVVTVAVCGLGREIEARWGMKKMTRSLAIAFVGGSASVIAGSFLMYRITSNTTWLYHSSYGGMSIVCVALLGMKQEDTESAVPYVSRRLGRLNWGQAPSVAIAIAALCSVLGLSSDFWMCLYGTFFCWIDLRFFYSGGDGSNTFAFETFFPAASRPLVGRLSAGCYRIFRACGLPQIKPRTIASPRSNEESRVNLVAERRRERALRALDAKLKEIEDADEVPLESWDDLAADEAA